MDRDTAERAARTLWESHRRGDSYANLTGALRPAGIDEAYRIQDAFHDLARPVNGPIAGWKIATTTAVMQQLMGIDRPCAGAIFAKTVHRSPARLRAADHVSLKIECELAFRLGADLPAAAAPFTAESVAAAVAAVMPAFELVDDRRAVYKETEALSLIADNCWNQGVVLGAPQPLPATAGLAALRGRLEVAGRPPVEGGADGPLRALAWVANLVTGRGGTIRAGMIVMTGSLVPTAPIAAGETAIFTVDGLGSARLEVV
ncbi:MAG: fumarylacetoacetate hydrolase family protein [Dongiaceae bacterium]